MSKRLDRESKVEGKENNCKVVSSTQSIDSIERGREREWRILLTTRLPLTLL
jgi:hypothetical protein